MHASSPRKWKKLPSIGRVVPTRTSTELKLTSQDLDHTEQVLKSQLKLCGSPRRDNPTNRWELFPFSRRGAVHGTPDKGSGASSSRQPERVSRPVQRHRGSSPRLWFR